MYHRSVAGFYAQGNERVRIAHGDIINQLCSENPFNSTHVPVHIAIYPKSKPFPLSPPNKTSHRRLRPYIAGACDLGTSPRT